MFSHSLASHEDNRMNNEPADVGLAVGRRKAHRELSRESSEHQEHVRYTHPDAPEGTCSGDKPTSLEGQTPPANATNAAASSSTAIITATPIPKGSLGISGTITVPKVEGLPLHPSITPATSSGYLPSDSEASEGDSEILLQPNTRPIDHEQLVLEVRAIYAGLAVVESKCIDIDDRQSAAAQGRDPTEKIELKNDQWQALIALHKQLLHEHHDFYMASQHPSASPALIGLAIKYSMPARMWAHGVSAFVKVLRQRLPESHEHMLAFLYTAYAMNALFYEKVPAFAGTWAECLGDISRYRMAIEDNDPKDREIWKITSQNWYNKAVDKYPNIGRIHHSLALLARPYSLEQLYLLSKSQACITPSESARDSIRTIFNPILHNNKRANRRPPWFEPFFVRIHSIFLINQPSTTYAQLDKVLEELESRGLLEKYVSKTGSRLGETGVYMAISNIAAILDYGTPQGSLKSRLRLAYEKAQTVKGKSGESGLDNRKLPSSTEPPKSDMDDIDLSKFEVSPVFIPYPLRFALALLTAFLKRTKDRNVYPLLHIYLAFIWSLIIVQEAWRPAENEIVWKMTVQNVPWVDICSFLNSLLTQPEAISTKVRAENLPQPDGNDVRPLPEDFAMRGQLYTECYFPSTWFTDTRISEDERILNLPSMVLQRQERLLWLGFRIASANRWIRYDADTKSFITSDCPNESHNA